MTFSYSAALITTVMHYTTVTDTQGHASVENIVSEVHAISFSKITLTIS